VKAAAYSALWAVAIAAALTWDYRDPRAPGHDSLVYGAHVYLMQVTYLGDLAWLIAGGLAFWLGMRALRGRL
jgi:hypothetical protein